MNYHVVLMCGATDCFPSAMFLDEREADAYGKLYSNNPEGYIVRSTDNLGLALAYFEEIE